MWHYLVIYDRRAGKIIRHHQYADPQIALTARFAAEREFREQQEIEIVVLGADSWDALKLTHSRYFKPVQELADAALNRETARRSHSR
jgi:hypothetical protein